MQAWVQVALRLREALTCNFAAWIGVTGSLELLSWIFALLALSATPHLNTRAAICCFLAFYHWVVSLKFSHFFFLSVFLSFPIPFSLPAALGLAGWPALQIWKGSTLQASQQMAVRTYARWCPLQHESCSAKRATVTVQQIQVVTTVVGGRSKQLFREVLHVCLWWFLAAALKCSVCWVTTGIWTPPVSTVKQMSKIRGRTSGSAHASDEDCVPKCTHTFTRAPTYVYVLGNWRTSRKGTLGRGQIKVLTGVRCFHAAKKTEQFRCPDWVVIWQSGWKDEEVKRVSAMLAWLSLGIQETSEILHPSLFPPRYLERSLSGPTTPCQASLRGYLWCFALCSIGWYFWSWMSYADPKQGSLSANSIIKKEPVIESCPSCDS